MNILLYRWGAYTELDIEEQFKKCNISVKIFMHPIKDKNNDESFENVFDKELKSFSFDAVFSINYFPVIAKVCNKHNIKYISWSYDNPLNVVNIEETLGLSTNYVFMFDRMQAESYINKGFNNVYYLTLAAPVDRYNNIQITKEDVAKYASDISFVGNLYGDMFSQYIAPLTDYQKGYLNGICNAQKELYGSYIIDDLVSDKIIEDINKQYKIVNPNTEVVMSKEALSYAMASHITRDERLTILALLSSRLNLDYYSKEKSELLVKGHYKGTCDYFTEMPKVFKLSEINLNITLKILKSGIPLRVLDIMACGGLVLTNYQPEIAEYFVNEEEIVMYDSVEDAIEKAMFLNGHKDIAKKIATNGYEKVSKEFSYKSRIEAMFKIAGIS